MWNYTGGKCEVEVMCGTLSVMWENVPGEKDWKKIKSFIEIDWGSGGINLFIAFFFVLLWFPHFVQWPVISWPIRKIKDKRRKSSSFLSSLPGVPWVMVSASHFHSAPLSDKTNGLRPTGWMQTSKLNPKIWLGEYRMQKTQPEKKSYRDCSGALASHKLTAKPTLRLPQYLRSHHKKHSY